MFTLLGNVPSTRAAFLKAPPLRFEVVLCVHITRGRTVVIQSTRSISNRPLKTQFTVLGEKKIGIEPINDPDL